MGQVSMQHESVSQIGKQLWLKLRNKLSLNPVSIRILEVQKTRSRISKPTLMILMIDVCEIFAMVSLISCQQKSHRCYRARLHEVNTNRFEISLRDQISLRCEVTSLSRFTWRSETHFDANFTSVKLTEFQFQTAVSFPCKQ